MKLLDLLIFYMGVYGISWSLIYAKPLQPIVKQVIKINKDILSDLFTCIVCISFWVSLPFLFLYFPEQIWFTKILVHFSTITFTWVLAHILED